MKERLKKGLKLEKRTIRKLDVRSGLRGGAMGDGKYTVVNCDSVDCDTVWECIPVSTVYLCNTGDCGTGGHKGW